MSSCDEDIDVLVVKAVVMADGLGIKSNTTISLVVLIFNRKTAACGSFFNFDHQEPPELLQTCLSLIVSVRLRLADSWTTRDDV